MRTVQIVEYGSTANLKVTDAEPPADPGEGQVLVRVVAAGINPFDSALTAGYLAEYFPLELPTTVGGDFAGTVEKVGPNVGSVTVGDKIIGHASVVTGGTGSFAEFVLAPADSIAKAPASVGLVEAAGLPLSGACAIQALRTIEAGPGKTILVLGGGGSVGSISVQLAKNAGATVIASATGDDMAYVASIGADRVYDYKDPTWFGEIDEADGVLDASSVGVDAAVYAPILRPGGHVVMLRPEPYATVGEIEGVDVKLQGTRPTTEDLAEVARLVDAGVVHLRIGATFPVEKAPAAFAAARSADGKTVVAF